MLRNVHKRYIVKMSKAPDGTQACNLIDLSGGNDFLSNSKRSPQTDDNTGEATNTNSEDDVQRNSPGGNYGRLCGYLNKQGSRGLLKTFRKRWFVFSPDNCKLYYYRSSQDQVPLGEIDISKATFSFDVSKAGLFTISVPGRSYFLEANNRQTCLFWLQELQKFRRVNSVLHTEQLYEKSNFSSNLVGHPKSGLLGNVSSSASDEQLKHERIEAQLVIPVDFPSGAIGDGTHAANKNPLSVAQQKFNNLRNQVAKSLQNKSLIDLSSPNNIESEQVSGKNSSEMNLRNSTFFSELSLKSPCKEDVHLPPSPGKGKAQALSAFCSRISGSFRKSRSSEDEESSSRQSWRSSCAKCRTAEERIEELVDEVSTLQDEVNASRALIKVLQSELDLALKEKETLTLLNEKHESIESLKLLASKDAEIVNLTNEVQQQKQEMENLQNHVMSLKKELAESQKQNDVFQETLLRKDSTIITLTNEVFDLETERSDNGKIKRKSSRSMSSLEDKSTEPVQDLNDVEYLKDAVHAFELQNKFLNKEVLELNELRSYSEQREFALTMRCSEWEARCCQIQSKLLFLLNELNKPDFLSDAEGRSREVISRLLEEAMADSKADASLNLPKWSFEESYDELGFNWKWGKEDLLSTKAQNLKQRSEDITNKAKEEVEITSWRMKWDNFIVTIGDKALQRSPELKMLLRMGIPREYKGRIWKGCVDMVIKFHKRHLGSNYYEELLNSKEFLSRLDPSSKQIELDLLRTLPNNRHYENLDSDGIPKLRRVLLAYSRHDPSVGYCQGLNRLAAIALLFMDEEDAFWCLVAIIKYLMPEGYYSRTLIASQVDQRVLKDLMSDKIPRLHSHLEQYNIDLSLFTFNWFLTVFIDNVPVDTYLRIWDVFLYEGSKVLFRYALAFFKYCENDILQLKDYIAISRYLRNMAENMTDIKRLSQIAFGELNPFPQRSIDTKRAQHMFVVKAQLDEFESLRNSLPRDSGKEVNIEYPSEED